MKNKLDNAPDLEAAFEAVKGVLFGPLDPVYVKHKFSEMIRDARGKHELERGLQHPFSLDREERKERDHRNLTLTALLASDAAYRAAHERAIVAFARAGSAMDVAIEAGEKALADMSVKIEDYLVSTARLGDGRYVMFDERDGVYRDQNFEVISPEDLAEVDGQTIKSILPYKLMMEWKDKAAAELELQRGRRNEVGDWENAATDDATPIQQEILEEQTDRAADYEKDAREAQEYFARALQLDLDRGRPQLMARASSPIAVPQMP